MKKLIMILTLAFGLSVVGGEYVSPVKAQTTVKTKKPWSKKKKYAVIGGAAGGYILGKRKDKRTGRQ